MQYVFDINIPTAIHFGAGITELALKKQNSYFNNFPVLLVSSGKSLKAYGHTDNLIKALLSAGAARVHLFDKISPNPRVREIEEGVIIGKQEKVACVVGFGGGSAIDGAKAIAAGIAANEGIEEMFRLSKEPGAQTLPVIAIPTTAGTGSETSKGAILTCEKTGIKGGLRGNALYPKAAIINPEYTYTAPLLLSMETGFDVISHAMESYISDKASPFSQLLSEKALKIAGANLPRLAQNLEDKTARKEMCYASMLMGINLGNTGTALPHRMQYPIGARTDTSHAAGIAALYPAWIDAGYTVSKEKFDSALSMLLGSPISSRENAIIGFNAFLKELGVNYTLSSLGIKKSDIPAMIQDVSGDLAVDPVYKELGHSVLETIYKNSF